MSSSKEQNEYKQELDELQLLETRRNIEHERGIKKIKARRKALKKLLTSEGIAA